MSSSRKSAYKAPPSSALEEQKRRRAQRIDSSRNLDLFAGLNLGPSDDEDEEVDEGDEPLIAREGLVQFAAMLVPGPSSTSADATTSPAIAIPHEVEVKPALGTGSNKTKKKRRKGKGKGKSKKPSKYADKCMYAELLEMRDPSAITGEYMLDAAASEDGLPHDMDTPGAWVAVAPVPKGKRCLAVTYQASSGGAVPNTSLRSRLLGKSLMAPFPSSLPPNTILDCILDDDWRNNGILHVLDCVRWMGRDVGDCEVGFRFWWRDTRLAELPPTVPPPPRRPKLSQGPPSPSISVGSMPSSRGSSPFTPSAQSAALPQPDSSHRTPPSLFPPVSKHTALPLGLHSSTPEIRSDVDEAYRFPYPTTLVPVPYDADTSLPHLLQSVIPRARAIRHLNVQVPSTSAVQHRHPFSFSFSAPHGDMEVEMAQDNEQGNDPVMAMNTMQALIRPDGMLLYVASATYEPGTSPLSSWVPIDAYADEHHPPGADPGVEQHASSSRTQEPPLSMFERLVRRRLAGAHVRVQGHVHQSPLTSAAKSMDAEVEDMMEA
ncbi:hypothetical protein PUNSTDRAFT_143736 [Punctularia strigosozonata HHB-11173 SS5]|uniref:uncharacterized protein n=1 Tax=Punctularia strigosozonata (strain HHB-11173) TaxID=741275 RepID=UPI000441735B|nr:uncharacterized protein PUNSTDRAFT_143736 [Punctularia strigosozonata HHB-11173 SS5]EIN09166.1 hypothetical protein PUNSTDRAFT_143736 [Punctularia strigosozonata HHB-11173 SS5]